MTVTSPAGETGSVTVERVSAAYLVAAEHPAPEDLRWRLDGVMRNRIASACGSLLSQALDDDDPSVWLIRRLDVDLAVDAGAVDDALLAQAWSRRMATGIVRAIAFGADGDTVLRFPDRAAYLAHFAGDLAEGRAWGKWYYAAFDSLRSLPTSAALREALMRESEVLEAVLLALVDRGRFEQVVAALSENDARRVYQSCFGKPATGDGKERWIEEVLSAWPEAALRASESGVATGHNALRLYAAVRACGVAAEDGLRDAIDYLLDQADRLRRAVPTGAPVACLAASDLRAAIERARRDGMLLELAGLSILKSSVPTSVAGETRAAARLLASPFGGIFLLIPALLDLGLHELIDETAYLDPEITSKAQVLRFLLALKCLGQRRAAEALHDHALRFITGADERLSLEALQSFGKTATHTNDRACLRMLIERLARRGRIDGRCLFAELLPAPLTGYRLLLIRDAAYDEWVYANCIADDDSSAIHAALDEGLNFVRESAEAPAQFLVVGPGLGDHFPADAGAQWSVRMLWMEPDRVQGWVPIHVDQSSEGEALTLWAAEMDTPPADIQALLARYLARAKPAAHELASFSLADWMPSQPGGIHFDLTWSLVARAVLKTFAARLMGFDWSSGEYLHGNFLDGTSTVRIESDRIDVHLPACPLQIVLRMAGVNGQTYTIPWLNGAQVTLHLPEG